MPFTMPQFPLLSAEQASPYANLISNAMKNYQEAIKAKYLPVTTEAEAASKLAYANLMAPQFLAKLAGNEDFMANLNENQRKQLQNIVYSAGTGQGTGGNFLQSQGGYGSLGGGGLGQGQGLGQPGGGLNSFFSTISNLLTGRSNQPAQTQGQEQPQIAERNGRPVPVQPMGTVPSEFGANNRMPDNEVAQFAQERSGAIAPNPPDQMARDKEGNLITEYPKAKPKKDQDYFERAGEATGIKTEKKEAGKYRAEDMRNLDNSYRQAVEASYPIQELIDIVKDPTFQNLRRFPGFQELQLKAKSKIGTPQEQEIIGRFTTTSLKAVAEAINGFRGRVLDKEVGLSTQMKISPNDTIGVMAGKLPAIYAFNELIKRRDPIARKIMETEHVSLTEAMERADKQVNGAEIRKQVQTEIRNSQRPSEEDIALTMKNHGISREELGKRLGIKGL